MKQKYRNTIEWMNEAEVLAFVKAVESLTFLKSFLGKIAGSLTLRRFEEVSLAGEMNGKHFSIYLGDPHPSKSFQLYRLYWEGESVIVMDGQEMVSYFKKLQLPKFDENKIYLIKSNTGIYKLQYIAGQQYAWIDMSSSAAFANGFFGSGEQALNSYKGEYVTLDNQSAMIQWMYINR